MAYYDCLLCSRCHQPITDVNEAHWTDKRTRCAPKKPSKGAFVYLMHDVDQDLLKIGFTEDPPRRFKEIRNANNNRIEFIGFIPGTKTNEAILHRQFKAYRRKLEWFDYSLDIIDYFTGHPNFTECP